MATQGEMYEERSEMASDREGYPQDKSGKIPMGPPQGHIPGSAGRNDSITQTRTVSDSQESGRSACRKADEMTALVPGAGAHRSPVYKR